MKVRLIGELDQDFISDLEHAGARLVRPDADLMFLAVESAEPLGPVAKLSSRMEPKKGIWIVYPKGVSVIREIDVIRAGHVAGLKDTKVTAFSATHTALRFSKPETAA